MSDDLGTVGADAVGNPIGNIDVDATQPRKRGRPRGSKGGTVGADVGASVSPAALDGGTGSDGTGSGGDNSGDNRSGTGRTGRGRAAKSEKETPLSVSDFVGVLSLAQVALFNATKAPEFLLSAEQNDLLATRYAAAASHVKTNFLTKAQKDIGFAIAATAMVFYAQTQAFYQRKAEENAPVNSSAFEMPRAA